MIIFENPGEIDVASIATFGVSVKESENPIGFFGTGLKYAIAILLRTGHEVTILSGKNKIAFGTETVTIRGKEFDVVTMNGERLGFTTEVGKTWELWMAYRELFCNARDEYGDVSSSRTAPDPEAGRTFVIVAGREFEAIHAERWRYFLEGEPDFEIDGMKVHRATSVAFFYRDVRVMGWPRAALMTYSDNEAVELTEDRTVKNSYEPMYRVARILMKLKDPILLREILTAPEDKMEHHLDFNGWGTPPSEEFLNVVGALVNEGITDVNSTAKKVWEAKRPKQFQPRETQMTEVQQKALSRALDFCEKIGFQIRDTYPICVVESLGMDTLGLAKSGTIFVSERAFHMGGTKQVASTLIEEYVHLRHSYVDCTRAMQNWLFERMVSLGEELVGEPL